MKRLSLYSTLAFPKAYRYLTFILSAACRRYILLLGMNLLPLSSMRSWLLSCCGVKIGKDCYIGFGVFVDTNYPQLITIGKNVTISHHCALLTHSQSPISHGLLKDRINQVRSVKIDDGAWLGFQTIVLPGATISRDCFIAAGSVVPPMLMRPASLYAGNPCCFKKSFIVHT